MLFSRASFHIGLLSPGEIQGFLLTRLTSRALLATNYANRALLLCVLPNKKRAVAFANALSKAGNLVSVPIFPLTP